MAFLNELRATFADCAARAAVRWGGRSYSYGELERLSLHAAARLQARGMGPGDRVAVWTADRFAFLVAHLGVLFGGVTALLEQTGGTDRLAVAVARVATPDTAPALMAVLCGAVSVYSSTTGVVLPVFLPLVPGLVEQLGGSDPPLLASAVVVGGNLADASPLSTIGVLCLASATGADRRCSAGC